MKSNFTRVAVILTIVMFFYDSCKKTAIKPAANTTDYKVDYKALSGQIAQNLYNSLTGKYGGANISEAFTVPHSNAVHGGPVLNSLNLLCGYGIDTTYHSAINTVDTAKTFFEHTKLVFICDNVRPYGYNETDTLVNTEDNIIQTDANTYFHNNYSVGQDYIVRALDLTYKNISMNGSINVSIINNSRAGAASQATSSTVAANYILTGLTIKITNGIPDVTTGKATFTMHDVVIDASTGPNGFTGNFTGTIQFLGNHSAKVTESDGTTTNVFTVDLLTGAVTG